MRLHWKGTYNGDENRLARWDHPEGTVAFQKAETRRSWQGKQESFLDGFHSCWYLSSRKQEP